MCLSKRSHYQSECVLVCTSVSKRIHLKDLKCHLKSKERRTPMEETKKLPVAERVEKKTMGMTKWFTEQYFQTYTMVSKDPRYKTLPPYNQTSCIATIMIATNAALDKIREKDARETAEILETMSKANEQTGKVA